MSFAWKQLVDIARQLEAQADKEAGDSEALRRTAVGRAYYGAFCAVRNFAVTHLNYRVKGYGDDHGALRAHLKGKWKGVADRLERLRCCGMMPIMQMIWSGQIRRSPCEKRSMQQIRCSQV